MAASQLYLYDKSDACMSGAATNFVAEDPSDHAREAINNPGDIVKALGKYSGLQMLIFDTHGAPGKLGLDIPFLTSNAPLLNKCTGSMAANARILFIGCSIANGSDGRDFLTAIGRNLLLGKGGIVGGATVGTYMACLDFLSLFTESYLPRYGQLRLISFDTGGAAIKEKLT
jgi:hypothetical protein